MADKPASDDNHSKLWWWVKVVCGFLLIAGAVHNILSLTAASVPLNYGLVLAARILVVFGAGVFVWHFVLVKRQNENMQQPERLTTQGGLFAFVRHPMYLADLIYYAGLALFWPGALSALILLIAAYALVQQSQVEDAWCAQRFPSEHQAWKARSRLLFPGLY